MDKNHDKVFFATFGVVLGALGTITLICITAANLLTPAAKADDASIARLDERTRPVATVITDPAALLKVSASAPHAAQSPDQILTCVCSACHGAGLLGAPKLGDKAAWSARAGSAGGANGLAASAIKGKNQMPPRGGAADLTDAEIKATIELMLKKAGI